MNNGHQFLSRNGAKTCQMNSQFFTKTLSAQCKTIKPPETVQELSQVGPTCGVFLRYYRDDFFRKMNGKKGSRSGKNGKDIFRYQLVLFLDVFFAVQKYSGWSSITKWWQHQVRDRHTGQPLQRQIPNHRLHRPCHNLRQTTRSTKCHHPHPTILLLQASKKLDFQLLFAFSHAKCQRISIKTNQYFISYSNKIKYSMRDVFSLNQFDPSIPRSILSLLLKQSAFSFE